VRLLRPARRYRHNWALLDRRTIGADLLEGPLMIRYRLIRVPWFGVFVHHIFRPDADRDLHDHPWPFASFVIWGSYTEVYSLVHDLVARARVLLPQQHYRRHFSFHRMPLNKAHMITQVEPGTWTLVFVGRRQQDWGFYVQGGWVPWREYVSVAGSLGPDPFDS
jgi:hypothetical protein